MNFHMSESRHRVRIKDELIVKLDPHVKPALPSLKSEAHLSLQQESMLPTSVKTPTGLSSLKIRSPFARLQDSPQNGLIYIDKCKMQDCKIARQPSKRTYIYRQPFKSFFIYKSVLRAVLRSCILASCICKIARQPSKRTYIYTAIQIFLYIF